MPFQALGTTCTFHPHPASGGQFCLCVLRIAASGSSPTTTCCLLPRLFHPACQLCTTCLPSYRIPTYTYGELVLLPYLPYSCHLPQFYLPPYHHHPSSACLPLPTPHTCLYLPYHHTAPRRCCLHLLHSLPTIGPTLYYLPSLENCTPTTTYLPLHAATHCLPPHTSHTCLHHCPVGIPLPAIPSIPPPPALPFPRLELFFCCAACTYTTPPSAIPAKHTSTATTPLIDSHTLQLHIPLRRHAFHCRAALPCNLLPFRFAYLCLPTRCVRFAGYPSLGRCGPLTRAPIPTTLPPPLPYLRMPRHRYLPHWSRLRSHSTAEHHGFPSSHAYRLRLRACLQCRLPLDLHIHTISLLFITVVHRFVPHLTHHHPACTCRLPPLLPAFIWTPTACSAVLLPNTTAPLPPRALPQPTAFAASTCACPATSCLYKLPVYLRCLVMARAGTFTLHAAYFTAPRAPFTTAVFLPPTCCGGGLPQALWDGRARAGS